MTPQVLISDFFGKTTFPHYLKLMNKTTDSFEANVLYAPDSPIEKGGFVTLGSLQKNTPIYKVRTLDGKRNAKGVWDAYGFVPKYAEISVSLCGYWDDLTNEVSPKKI